jgi:hypothetical protein
VRQGLQAPDREPFPTYHYIHLARCQNPSGDMVTGATSGVPFSLYVIEDPWVYFTYAGDWITRPSRYATGGTTHEARQVGATANLSYPGIAAAWVTTLDEDKDVQASVMWDTCIVTFACPDTVNTGDEFGDARVVKWSSSWTGWYGNSYNRAHTVQVTSHESRLVDVDAFVLVRERRP